MPKKNPIANELFWRARLRASLSRAQLADQANQEPVMATCNHVPMNENWIGRIEQGRIGGGICRERLAAICSCLDVDDPADIGLVAERRLPTRLAPTHSRRRVDDWAGDRYNRILPGWQEEQKTDSVFDVARINRRPLLDSLRALSADLGLIGVEQAARRLVGIADIDHLVTITALCRTADRQAGGGVLVDEIDNVARLAPNLLHHTMASGIESKLFVALAELRYLAGWTAFDAMQFTRASGHFTAAERFATESGDRSLLAFVRYGQAKQLQHQRDNREALQVLALAHRGHTATPALTATIRGTEAASLAALGDFDAARAALDDAVAAHANVVPGNEPNRLAFRDLGEVYAQYGRVYRDWARRDPDQGVEAVRWNSKAIAELGPSSIRSTVLNRVGLTSSYFLAGDPDRAIAEGAHVLHAAVQINSPRVIDRIANLRRDAIAYRGNSAVDDFLASLPQPARVAA